MAVIGWNNLVDTSTITNSTATGSEVLDKENLKVRQLGNVFRHTFPGAGTLLLDFDLGSTKLTKLIGVLGHDLQGLAYTISFGTSAGASDVGSTSGTFWEGTPWDAPHELLYVSAGFSARHVRLSVTVPGTRTIDIGRVWLDSAWETRVSMDFSLAVVDRSTLKKSRGGSVYNSTRPVLRQLVVRAFGISDIDLRGDPSDPDMKSFLTMDLAVGMHAEVLMLAKVDSQISRQRLGVYGHLQENQPIRVLDRGENGHITEKRFVVEEDR